MYHKLPLLHHQNHQDPHHRVTVTWVSHLMGTCIPTTHSLPGHTSSSVGYIKTMWINLCNKIGVCIMTVI